MLSYERALMGAGGLKPETYIEDVFSTWLYIGTGSTQTITNGIDLSGEGGLLWLKKRSSAGSHYLADTVRGNTKIIEANDTTGEVTNSVAINSFNSDGFTVGNDLVINSSLDTIASWTFRKAPGFFDVVTYTGTGSARTVAHNLGSVPGFIMVKRTDTTGSWRCFHTSTGATQYLELDTNSQALTQSTVWNDTAPTASVFTVGTDATVNASGGTYVAYLFAHDEQIFGEGGDQSVIKCGGFTGANYTENLGWEPQWLLAKRTDGVGGDWYLIDNTRGFFVNADSKNLSPNVSTDENTAPFKLTNTGFAYTSSLASYIYIAIRRGPLKTPKLGTSVMNTVLYTGLGSSQTITGVGFPPDTVWLKCRTLGTNASYWFDSIRGAFSLDPPDLNKERSRSALYTFDYGGMDGFRLTSGNSVINSSGESHLGWCFRKAIGCFDSVSYTGTGVARTVSHNLGVAPELMIVKNTSNSSSWNTYTASLGPTKHLDLDTNSSFSTNTFSWNDTAPTSSVFTAGSNNSVSNETYIAHLFATCPGVSKIGSYSGSNSTVNVDCGFTTGARWVMIKRTDSTGHWYIWDTARGIVSGNDPFVLASQLSNENGANDYIDPYSPGFSLPGGNPDVNTSGGSYIFLAFS